MATTPHLGLILLEQAQSQKEITVNTALMKIDALLNTRVLDKDLSAPPVSPVEGDLYIVAASATGEWAGYENHIAYFEQVWRFITPNSGLMLWVEDESKHYLFDGAEWSSMSTSVGALEDLTNVVLSSLSDGQALTYDAGASQWVNSTVTSGGGGYTDEEAQDAVGNILADSSTIDFTYSDATPSITAIVKDTSITYAKIQNVSTTDRLLGRATAGSGVVEEITCTAAGRALIDDANASAQLTTLGVSTFVKTLLDDADASAARSTLGLGTAATMATGTSGATIPLLNAANTWSSSQQFPSGSVSSPGVSIGTSNTGFYASASGWMDVSIDGARAMSIIGTSSQLYLGGRAGLTSSSAVSASGGVVANYGGGGTQSYMTGTGNNNHHIFYNNCDSAPSIVGYIRSNGTSTSFLTSSDYRLKRDAQPIENAAAHIMALRPLNYAWVINQQRSYGFFAHEVQEIVPDAVSGEKDAVDEEGNPLHQSIDYSKLVPLLAAALQEALVRIALLEGNAE